MRVLAACLLFVPLAACRPPAPPTSRAPARTPEQEARWKKVRRDTAGGLAVVTFAGGRGTILARETGADPKDWVLPPQKARGEAEHWAGKEYVDGVAVADLSSRDEPFAVAWYYDDGTGVRRYDAPPTPGLAAAWEKYVQDVTR
jgi:hypothetical protein